MYRMSTKYSSSQNELKKLYSLLDRVRAAALGADYKTRIEMKEMADKIVEKIKAITQQFECDKMDANHSQKDSQ
jgi:hypothetical protein